MRTSIKAPAAPVSRCSHRQHLMASVAFAALYMAGSTQIAGGANLDVNNGVIVNTSATTTTTDTTNTDPNAGNNNTDRIQSFTGANTSAISAVNANTINGFGLSLITDNAGGVSIVNNGTITTDNNTPATNNGALNLQSTTGAIQYIGTGTVTGSGTVSGLVASTSAGGGVTVQANGAITAAISGTGISASQSGGNGNVSVTTGAAVTGGTGISASAAGSGTVTVNTAAGGLVTGLGGSGILASSVDGNIMVTTGSVTGGNNNNVVSASTSGNGGISIVQQSGTITGGGGAGVGISAVTTGPTGGNIVVTTNAGSTLSMTGGTGILATQAGTGSVTVTVGGVIDPPNIGVDAAITNAANANNVTVHVDNSIDATNIGVRATTNGTGNVLVDGAGSIGAVTSPNTFGIQASNTGTSGSVTVSGAGTINGGVGSVGIDAQLGAANTNGNILVQRSGAISADNGVNAAINNAANPGSVTVTASGSVTANNGFGIRAVTLGTGTVTIDSIGGTVAATGGDAIIASSTSGAIVVRTDAVTATSAANNAINATATAGGVTVQANGAITGGTAGTGIIATNTGAGNVNVTATALVTGGSGIDAGSATTSGTVTVTAQGGVTAGAGFGIRAQGTTNTVTIDSTGGTVTATGGDAIIAGSTSGAIVVKTDAVTATSAANNAINATATAGGVTVQANGAITGGTAGTGIIATNTGAGNVNVTATALVTGGSGIDAGSATTSGSVTVTAQGGVTAGAGFGIRAQGTSNTVTVDSTGGTVMATGGDAIIASSSSGAIVVKTDAVTATSAANNAINAAATAGGVTVQANGAISGGTAGTGIIATNTGAGNVNVTATALVTGGSGIDAGSATTSGSVTVTAQGGVTAGAGFGIRARGTSGAVFVDTTGGTVTSNGGDGIIGRATTGAVTLLTNAVTAIGGNGINATTTNGAITVITAGAISSDTGVGIIADQTPGAGNGGNVFVHTLNTVTGTIGIDPVAVGTNNLNVTIDTNVTGTAGDGIITSVEAGTATVNINNAGTTLTGTGAGTSGLNAATGDGGATNIDVAVGALVTDTLGRGITTTAVGTGTTTLTNSGTIVGAGSVANPVISIGNAAGSVTITNNGPGLIANNQTATLALNNALAIATSTPGSTGANNINNSGILIGAISLGGGANTFTNLAGGQWVVSDGATFSAAAFGTNASNTLSNNLGGNIFMAGPSTNFTGLAAIANAGILYAGGSTTGLTNLNPNAGTAQTVSNTGVLNVNGVLNFANLGTQLTGSTFTNGSGAAAGTIDMSRFASATAPDGTVFAASTHAVTDRVTLGTTAVSGSSDLNYTYAFGPAYNFIGGANSWLMIDTNVGAPGSASDRLIISGTASGKTAIALWDTSNGPGSLNLTGITLAAVNGASSNAFFLSAQTNPAHQTPGNPDYDQLQLDRGPMGAIKKGFFFYPLLQDTLPPAGSAAGSRYALFGLPDVESFQLSIAMTAAQNLFNETVLGWNERQDEMRKWIRRGAVRLANANGSGADIAAMRAGVGVQPSALESGGRGFWIKGLASLTNRTSSQNLSSILLAAGVLGDLDLSYRQDVYGVVGGVDIAHEGLIAPYDTITAGVMGGYSYSSVNFKNSPTSFKFSGPSVGVSMSYLAAGWFLDGLAKADFLDLTMNVPTLAPFGLAGTSVKAMNLGGIVNAGHRWDWPTGWGSSYVEPILTVSYLNTRFDSFAALGTTAQFANGVSLLGGAGARTGTIWVTTDRFEVDTSLTARVWHQFLTNKGVTLSSLGPEVTLTDKVAATYGELSAQINLSSKRAGWSTFMLSSVKANAEFRTVAVKGGIRYDW